MANIRSQITRNARSERERLQNRRRTSVVRTYIRRLEEAVQAGDAERVEAEHRMLVSKIDKAVQHGAMHRNRGARKKAQAARLRSSV